MKTIFIGLIFILFDFSISVGSFTIGLIPSFVGFFLIAKGAKSLYQHSYSFKSANTFSLVAFVYFAVLYAIDLFALAPIVYFHRAVNFSISIISAVFLLGTLFHLFKGIQEIEEDHDVKIGYSQLTSCWKILLVSHLLIISAGFIPLLALLCLLLSVVISIVLLVYFHRTNKAFSSLSLSPSES